MSVAAINAPALGVMAGSYDAIAKLEQRLEGEKVVYRRLRTLHAFHSHMMDPVVSPFADLVRDMELWAPTIPFISSVSGNWISAEDAVDSDYWASHLRSAVRFSAGISELRKGEAIMLEVGPGNTLATLARQNPGRHPAQLIVTSFVESAPHGTGADSILEALGRLWTHGAAPNWPALYRGEARKRVSLPPYPFEGKRFWIEPRREATQSATPVAAENHMNAQISPAIAARPIEKHAAGEQGTQSEEHSQDSGTRPEGAETSSMAAPQTDDRQARIRSGVEFIFQDLSGIDVSDSGAGVSFLEMGFDSLFLTQVSQALQSKFGVKITFRQLLDQVSTLEALVAHLDKSLPPDALPAPAAQPAVPVVAAATGAGPGSPIATAPAAPSFDPPNGPTTNGTELEALFKNQLQAMSDLMARQIEALRSVPTQRASAAPEIMPAVNAPAVERAPLSVPAAMATAQPSASGPQPRKFIPFRPVDSQASTELTPAQVENLRALTERYNRKTAGSKRLTQEHRAHFADPRVAAGFRTEWKELVYPIVTVRSKGSKLWDVDGNEYIDVVNGYGPIMFGHSPDFVTEAVAAQLKIGFETGPQSPLACEVAQMITEMTGTERVSFCNTGSEAVVAALRVARTVTARNRVVLFAGSYHGMFDEVVVKAIPGPNGPRSLPVAPGIPREKVENVIVLDYGTDEALRYIEAHAGELAAVLVEPVQSRHP
ncbi:MAG TPA: aminotransferase class III-fold pyridoxal phosphate-dependent enzyme, partial [Candidatus Binataceae bacterium]|nr:aminotransferase class III-fold pyridoxal phosphate-dependent enzyme [Candidatus Binataceae bacterium]